MLNVLGIKYFYLPKSPYSASRSSESQTEKIKDENGLSALSFVLTECSPIILLAMPTILAN